MTLDADIEFIAQKLEALYEAWPDLYGPPSTGSTRAFGVPPDMQVGDRDQRGWVKWKLVRSTVTSSAVQTLETKLGLKFPQLFGAYLMTYFHLFDYLADGYAIARMPSTDPLRFLTTQAESRLQKQGFVVFGERNHGGAVALQTSAMSVGDCPVVVFTEKHVRVAGKLAVEHNSFKLCDSFREFMTYYLRPIEG